MDAVTSYILAQKYTDEKIASINIPSDGISGNNYKVTYTYNEYNQIEKEIVTGDINKTTTFTYYPIGSQDEGKIKDETIVENSITIKRTYVYTDGRITSVDVVKL